MVESSGFLAHPNHVQNQQSEALYLSIQCKKQDVGVLRMTGKDVCLCNKLIVIYLYQLCTFLSKKKKQYGGILRMSDVEVFFNNKETVFFTMQQGTFQM